MAEQMQPALGDWDGVGAEVNRVIAESPKPFTPETIANVRDFLKLVRDRCPIPAVAKGYWSTISVAWGTTSRGPLEIEIFGDRLEVYRFYDQRTDIWDEPHASGEPFSPAFLAELPWLPRNPQPARV